MYNIEIPHAEWLNASPPCFGNDSEYRSVMTGRLSWRQCNTLHDSLKFLPIFFLPTPDTMTNALFMTCVGCIFTKKMCAVCHNLIFRHGTRLLCVLKIFSHLYWAGDHFYLTCIHDSFFNVTHSSSEVCAKNNEKKNVHWLLFQKSWWHYVWQVLSFPYDIKKFTLQKGIRWGAGAL